MIPLLLGSLPILYSIPRESGDDPEVQVVCEDQWEYSPRERG